MRWCDVIHFEDRRVLLGGNWFGCVVVLALGAEKNSGGGRRSSRKPTQSSAGSLINHVVL